MTNYNQKTIDEFRKMGRMYWKVEYYNQYAVKMIDCFHFFDYLCIDPIDGIIAVQTGGPSGFQEHKKKILQNDYAARWINFAKIELWSWRRILKEKGKKRKVLKPRIEKITIEMFIESAQQMKMFEEVE